MVPRISTCPPPPWQRPSPLPQRFDDTPPAGGQSPRPAPAPPPAGASPPPGRALAFVARGAMVFAAPFRRGGGNAVRFLVPARKRRERYRLVPADPAPMANAIAFAMSQRRLPPRPWAGRWPALRLAERSCATVVSHRAANRIAFAGPPGWVTLFAVLAGCSHPGGGRTKFQQCDQHSALIGLFYFSRRISDDVSHRPPPMACTSP